MNTGVMTYAELRMWMIQHAAELDYESEAQFEEALDELKGFYEEVMA